MHSGRKRCLTTVRPVRTPCFNERGSRWGWYAAAAAIMWGLKYHYSVSGADQLDWILGPTAGLVGWLEGVSYTRMAGMGYVRGDHRIIIAPACAGLNFMIMAFGLTSVTGFRHWRRFDHRMLWLVGMLAGAYLCTLGVNTLRIHLSTRLFDRELAMGWLSPERLHRMAGIGVYFGSLWLYYTGMRNIMKRRATLTCPPSPGYPGAATARTPLGWYWMGALGVPLVHRIYRDQRLPDAEHCLTVILVSLIMWAGVAAIRRGLLSGLKARDTARAKQEGEGSGTARPWGTRINKDKIIRTNHATQNSDRGRRTGYRRYHPICAGDRRVRAAGGGCRRAGA